jgi:hypothetical protein
MNLDPARAPAFHVIELQDANKKNFLFLHFSAHYPFLKEHLHRFAEIKSHEEVRNHKTVGLKVFLTIFA